MLSNKKFTIVADTVVNEVKIASFGAVLNVDTADLTLYARQLDKEACKENRNTVRRDQAEFEDFAYHVQDHIKGTIEA